VPTALAEPGTELTIDVRGRPRRGRVVKKPIYRREERNGG
jgi:glycine cleavage system aminomethyltransferase T